jgi:hypothetical protein
MALTVLKLREYHPDGIIKGSAAVIFGEVNTEEGIWIGCGGFVLAGNSFNTHQAQVAIRLKQAERYTAGPKDMVVIAGIGLDRAWCAEGLSLGSAQ